jgi:hypothetical protein
MIVSPTPSDSSPAPLSTSSERVPYEVAYQEDLNTVTETLTDRTGWSCFGHLESGHTGLSDAEVGLVESLLADANEWVKPSIFVGSADALISDLGAELLVARDQRWRWLLESGADGLLAQMYFGIQTPDGHQAWVRGSSVKPNQDSECAAE